MPSINSCMEYSPFATRVRAFSQSAVSFGDFTTSGSTVISLMPSSVGIICFFSRLINPSFTNFSIMSARVAGVPNPFLSTSSSISSDPARSIMESSESSVNLLGGFVKCSLIFVCTPSNACPLESSGSFFSSAAFLSASSDVLKERLKASSKSFQPLRVTLFPETVKICPLQVSSAFTVSYRCFSPVAHKRRFAIKDRIFRSVSGSAARSASTISIVGIMAWWSVTFLLSITLFISGLNITLSSNKIDWKTALITFFAVCSISSDKNWLSVLG